MNDFCISLFYNPIPYFCQREKNFMYAKKCFSELLDAPPTKGQLILKDLSVKTQNEQWLLFRAT